MLAEHAGEFGEAARVLVLVRAARRRVGVNGRRGFDVIVGKELGILGGHLAIASRAAGSATEPQPQPAAVTEIQRSGWRMPICKAV